MREGPDLIMTTLGEKHPLSVSLFQIQSQSCVSGKTHLAFDSHMVITLSAERMLSVILIMSYVFRGV